MFVKNAWYIAGFKNAFKQGQPVQRWIIGKPLVLFRQSTGQLVALQDRCPHRQAPFSQGKIIDDTIACPYHGHQYNAEGKCTHMPFNKVIPPTARIDSYPVLEKHGFAWIWMGDKDKCDESALPINFDQLDNEEMSWVSFEDSAKADYELLNDNILDLTHVPYLHTIIGDSPLEQMELQVESDDRSVVVQRESQSVRPGFLRTQEGIPDEVKIKSRWDFSAPCYAAGNINYENIGVWSVRLAHIPTTPGNCIIYGMIGADFLPQSKETRAFLQNTFHTTLGEDKVMCEEIQKLIDAEPGFPQISVKTDAGGVYGRRVIEKLIAEEA